MKISQLQPDFVAYLRSENLSDRTIENYVSWLTLFGNYCDLEDLEAEGLNTETTRRYMEYLRDRKNLQTGNELSSSTRAKHFDSMKKFGNFLLEQGIITFPLTDGIRRPKNSYKIIQGFSSNQLSAILNAVKEVRTGEQYRDRLSVLLYLISSTGLRISEALQLKPISFDFDRRLFKVVGKGDIEREVPFSPEASEVIREYIDKYKIKRDAFIFVSRYGRPLNQSTIRDALKRIKRNLGAQHGIDRMRVSPHTFRHSFARSWVTRDGNTIALSRILGHTSTQMTSNYARLWGVDVVESYDRCGPASDLPIPDLKTTKALISN